MKNYYRIMLGRKSVFAEEGYQTNVKDREQPNDAKNKADKARNDTVVADAAD